MFVFFVYIILLITKITDSFFFMGAGTRDWPHSGANWAKLQSYQKKTNDIF